MFENVDGRTDDGRTTDAGVTGILIAHLRAFGSGELKRYIQIILAKHYYQYPNVHMQARAQEICHSCI